MSEPSFIPGLELSEAFYREAVKPIVQEMFPALTFSAGLIGSGSEVLGFDNLMSSDHHWGPRVMIFLSPADLARERDSISRALSDKLPRRFRGYPTSFTSPNGGDKGVQLLDYSDEGPVNHRVEMMTADEFFKNYLGFDITSEVTAADWLTFPEQKLRSLTAGKIFDDGLNLESARNRFRYYPHDVWLYLLAAGWARIEQEEHLMGRAGSVGDELGSAIIAARLVRDLMRLCFLMEKVYAPYPKWFGTAFSKLKSATELEPILHRVLAGRDWKERERFLSEAYEFVAALHNSLGITSLLPAQVAEFHDRPFMTISRGVFSAAIVAEIKESKVKKIAAKRLIGNIDQFSDSTDLLAEPAPRLVLWQLYD